MSGVPCGTQCALCCMNDKTLLTPEEVASGKYVTYYDEGTRSTYLQRQLNGHCVHLGPDLLCTVYEDRPSRCQKFDCRQWVRETPPEKQISDGIFNPHTKKIFARGLQLIAESS